MPSPLELIQSLTQKLQPTKTMGAEKSGSGIETEAGSEGSFSSILNQALKQPTGEQQPGTLNKSKSYASKDFSATPAHQTSQPEQNEKQANTPDSALLEAFQAQIAASDTLAQLNEGDPKMGLLANLSQLATQGTLPPEAQTSPTHEQAALPEAGKGKSTALYHPDVTHDHAASEATGKSPKADNPSDSIEMAQSFGLTTLSAEALGLMGMPIEFQMQQIINQPPAPSANPKASSDQTTMSALNNQSVNHLPNMQPMEPSLLNTSAQPNFEPTLLDATQDIPQSLSSDTVLETNFNLPMPEAAPDILKTESSLNPANNPLAASHELSYDASVFSEVLSEAQPLAAVEMDFTPKASRPANPDAFSALPDEKEDGLASLWQQPILNPQPQGNGQAANGAGNPTTAPTQSIASLHEKLSALNGEIETRSTQADNSEFALPETVEDSASSAQGLPQLASFDAASQPVANTPQANNENLPQIQSSSTNPADQVVDGTVYSVKNGHKELILKLNPDNLGEVRINLISHGNNEMSARLIASNPESHALLKSQADSLKASLEAQGIQIEKLSVILAGQIESTNPKEQTSQQDQPRHFEQNNHQSNNPNQQHQSFQQPEQNPNLFFQNGGQFQHRQTFAQNQGTNSYGQPDSPEANESATKAEGQSRPHDNGSLSLLA